MKITQSEIDNIKLDESFEYLRERIISKDKYGYYFVSKYVAKKEDLVYHIFNEFSIDSLTLKTNNATTTIERTSLDTWNLVE